ncbi:sulfite exporter TauE/SafE family protein [Tsukamurella sp. 8F]|uniref:sulfite exporter TauE/SafE family protein n=1 Tax=unclassified Tsukamurella TaxID=2633480 RepID=UPI0023B93BFD|nr:MULTISPECIES: sulfite exporter TauE/SafE family protein [unclassified Tsukamurella]MDF0528860.1 sulfite exporter TauE/SafE family protein [Tsukamurella sp. 8J]MDF0586695.1 sulfite exporter TauE/SafE family protein [Tsukamurella sp. 8F]
MTGWELLIVLVAGAGAGFINSLVGSGTLITFPTLVSFGVPPVTATISNAIGLVAGGVSSTWGYRRELAGQGSRLRWQTPASLLGALLGCYLLLHLPETVFESVVPVLLVLALILVIVGPRIQRAAAARADGDPTLTTARLGALVAGTFAVGVYGGYFTAAQGILLIAVMGVLLHDDMQRLNAAKNLLSLLVNVVAALTYLAVAWDRIDWPVAAMIAIGSLFGGALGSKFGRTLSPNALRAIIVVVGLIGLYRLLTT